jgi:hypothetical protein
MVPRGKVEDSLLYMCVRFPICPTITRVEAGPAHPPTAAPRPQREARPRPTAKPSRPAAKAARVERKKPAKPVVVEPSPRPERKRPQRIAAPVPATAAASIRAIAGDAEQLRRAVVLYEVLAPPVGLRDPARGLPFG